MWVQDFLSILALETTVNIWNSHHFFLFWWQQSMNQTELVNLLSGPGVLTLPQKHNYYVQFSSISFISMAQIYTADPPAHWSQHHLRFRCGLPSWYSCENMHLCQSGCLTSPWQVVQLWHFSTVTEPVNRGKSKLKYVCFECCENYQWMVFLGTLGKTKFNWWVYLCFKRKKNGYTYILTRKV